MSKIITQEEAENRAIKYGFKLLDTYISMKTKSLFLCGKCNKQFRTSTDDILYGKNKSCGCEKDKLKIAQIKGKRFGKLVVKEYDGSYPSYRNGKMVATHGKWKCICDCGNVKNTTTHLLTQGKTKSCGNCKLFRNGIPTSWLALDLHKIIGKGIHNYRTKFGPVIDIAFAYKGRKIAIEYDEWMWHRNQLDKDEDRIKKLVNNGWKVLSIKARRNLPTKEQIEKCIDNLCNGQDTETIVLENWGVE